ncbi:MAG: ATP-dependent DNA helicase RecG, partial [Abditibacteriota bacterium]|nr:ATP-dependent DNA helicase RecG [Abditibacteriota bacterium]
GDVGSGKTLTALFAMLLCCRNGMQAAIMAPTEILAEQHYLNVLSLLGDKAMEYPPVLIKGSLKAAEKRKAADDTASGQNKLIIGTHALIADKLRFHRLGLVVVDEQHRFGVLQRTALYEKAAGDSPVGSRPDMLLMTATPIPRTLTNAVYGDLDVSIIDTMPPGRQPVKTHWKRPEERPRVYAALKSLIRQGQQAYVVCPLIEGSEAISSRAATELYEELRTRYFPDAKIALLHGQQPTEEKESIMASFRKGETQILVSTSVIEVGVDVPNATCMIIESADRFGLSQLHQLRGRVGRGSQKSFCVLISDGATEDSRKRMEIMTETTNGFVIAEEDLKMRGPGELSGVRQSGLSDFRVADIFRDGALLKDAKALAKKVIDEDPALEGPGWQRIKPGVLQKTKELEGTTD